MGILWSKRQTNHHHHHHHHQQPHSPSLPSSSSPPPPLLTPPPPAPLPGHLHPPTLPPPPPATFSFASNSPHPVPSSTPYPPPVPYIQHPVSNPYYSYTYNHNYARPMMSQPNFYHSQTNGWLGFRPPAVPPPPPPLPPAPYVDHQSAKKIRNDVNVHKDTIKVKVDESNKDCYLVSFVFDAMVDGSITIFYFAKEGDNCTFTPIYPEVTPVKIPFQKGLGQKFCQPSGSGFDLGFFDIDDLSKPSPEEDVFPLVILAESCSPSTSQCEQPEKKSMDASNRAQITQAVLEKNRDGHFQVKVIKQILWVDMVRYELREIYGISNTEETTISDVDTGKECVICMTEPKDTAVLPCRHMCLCSECAKELRLQSNKCPICRQPIQELLGIKVNEGTS